MPTFNAWNRMAMCNAARGRRGFYLRAEQHVRASIAAGMVIGDGASAAGNYGQYLVTAILVTVMAIPVAVSFLAWQ